MESIFTQHISEITEQPMSCESGFCDMLERDLKKFNVQYRREVTGTYVYNPPHRKRGAPRVDFVVKIGGVLMGLECKCPSGVSNREVNMGRAISQAMDYVNNAVFHLKTGNTFLDYVFIGPTRDGRVGAIASILQQNRLGTFFYDSGSLIFRQGAVEVACASPAGGILKVAPTQTKVGSR